MKVPFFSIIIPVYNGLSHDLPTCLDSIWNQPIDYGLYEVICIDDCSTDNTRSWLHEQLKKHDNLYIIENEVNIRQGGARNKGVELARGKYIMFIDQDDYYHYDGVKSVYNVLQNSDLDILINDSAFEYKGKYSEKLQLNFGYKEVCLGEDFIYYNGWPVAPWRFVIRREYYISNNFAFEGKCRIEDIDWSLKILFYAKRVQYKGILLIHYIQGETSTTDTMYKHKETLIDGVLAANRALSIANDLYLNKKSYCKVISYLLLIYNNSCKYLLGLYLPIQEKVEIIKMIPVIKNELFFMSISTQIPVIYSCISNISVPFFRLIRGLYRYYKKKIR